MYRQKFFVFWGMFYIICILYIFLCLRDVVHAQTTRQDIWTSMDTYYSSVKNKGSFNTLAESWGQGNIYEKAYAQSVLHTVYGSLLSLDYIYENLLFGCTSPLTKEDVSKVFAETNAGKQMHAFLLSKGISSFDYDNFEESCIRVLQCALQDVLLQNNKKIGGYGPQIRNACIALLSVEYESIYPWFHELSAFSDTNHSDDMFVNASLEDSPYDILYDVEHIGDMLFAHNDPAAETHFYYNQSDRMLHDSKVMGEYPLSVSPYKNEGIGETGDLWLRRLPSSNGVYYDSPDSVFIDVNNIVGSSIDRQARSTNPGFPQYKKPEVSNQKKSGNGLGNQCIQNVQENNVQNADILDLAIGEQVYNTWYNKSLDLRGISGQEKDTGNKETKNSAFNNKILGGNNDDSYENISFGDMNKGGTLIDALGDVFWTKEEDSNAISSETQEKLLECVKQFTDSQSIDFQSAKRLIRKTITQPTALTQCVLGILCRETEDPSGRNMYRIQGCTFPARTYAPISNQSLYSVEESIDEMLNICRVLQDTDTHEYNKTKDALDHKMMRVSLGEKFSFTLNVGFAPLFSFENASSIQNVRIEKHKKYESFFLNIDNNYSFEKQRNKYVRLYKKSSNILDDERQERARREKEEKLKQMKLPGNQYLRQMQQKQYNEIIKKYEVFVEGNRNMRYNLAGITQGMSDSWQQEARE